MFLYRTNKHTSLLWDQWTSSSVCRIGVTVYVWDQRSTLCCGKQQLLCGVLRAHIYTPNPSMARGERNESIDWS